MSLMIHFNGKWAASQKWHFLNFYFSVLFNLTNFTYLNILNYECLTKEYV